MAEWSFVFDQFDAQNQGVREALCTLANGYIGTRGAYEEAEADGHNYPGSYIAGCYNRLTTGIANHVVENEDLVNIPNWLPLRIRVQGGDWLDVNNAEILSFEQELDLRHGFLRRKMRLADAEGRVFRLSSRRFVHMGERHLAGIELSITPENWSGRIEILSALDGRVENKGVARYRDLNGKHLAPSEGFAIDGEITHLTVRTTQSSIQIAETARTTLHRDGMRIDPDCKRIVEEGYVALHYAVEVHQGEALRVEKIAAIYTSRDPAISECGLASRAAIDRAGGFESLAQTHAALWESLWHWFDIVVDHVEDDNDVDGETSLILRLHLFHLLQVTPRGSLSPDVGIPARGLHGEAYRGHIFWDELFVFPTLNYRLPTATRSLLMYRYNRLAEARERARCAGLQGALYPWQSGSDGREESQALHLNPQSGRWIPDNSALQRHVNAAIAYNIWQYYQVTGDLEFMSFYGAKVFLEIARCWASLAQLNPDTRRYELCGLMGPDEYHDGYPDSDEPGLKNNAYSNIMAAWCLWRALELLETLPRDVGEALRHDLEIDPAELRSWDVISRKLVVHFHDDGVISQFEGYDRLEEFDWDGYREKYGDIQRLDRILESEGDTPNRFKASKQADVLMLFYLFSAEELGALFERLGYPFRFETIPKNIEYYGARTSHGSTLSRVVGAWVNSRLDRPRSWYLFKQALQSDFNDIQGGTTAEGIHLGAMAGTVDIMQRCYTGIEVRNDVLWLNPCLPKDLNRLTLNIRYRGHTLHIDVSQDKVCIASDLTPAAPIDIGIKDEIRVLASGSRLEAEL